MSARGELIRRQRLGDIRRLLLYRYGPNLPNDDAGREDLIELLKPISLGRKASVRMAHEIELVARWLDAAKAEDIIEYVSRLPIWERKIKADKLGQRFRVTAERERLRLSTIAPVDMTADDLAEQRKAKKRAKMARYRRKKGKRPRAE